MSEQIWLLILLMIVAVREAERLREEGQRVRFVLMVTVVIMTGLSLVGHLIQGVLR